MAGDYLLEGLAVPATLDHLHDLLERVGAEQDGVATSDLMLFETAVIEVAGNVVEHGHPPGEVRWTFRLQVLPDRLEGCLSDEGQEYPGGTWGTQMPEAMSEDGRGLALASAVLDSLTYERADDTNHWTMVRRRRS